MILSLSPEIWRAEGAWRLEGAPSFKTVHPQDVLWRCSPLSSFVVGVWEGFSNQWPQGEESIFIVQQAGMCTSDRLLHMQHVWLMGSSSIS